MNMIDLEREREKKKKKRGQVFFNWVIVTAELIHFFDYRLPVFLTFSGFVFFEKLDLFLFDSIIIFIFWMRNERRFIVINEDF